MSAGTIVKGATGSVYVLRRHSVGRATMAYSRPGTYAILTDHYDDLPDDAREAFDALCANERASTAGRKRWAESFIDALDSGSQALPRQRGADVDRNAPSSDLTTREIVLRAVWAAGARGMTAAEIKAVSGVHSDGISGGLAELHLAGVLARLAARR